MDKEAQEKIKRGMFFSDRCQFCHDFGEKIQPYLCPDCLGKIYKLGYHKLPEGKPPLLSDDKICDCLDKAYRQLEETHGKHNMRENRELRQQVVNEYNDNLMRNIAQAQRDSDIKWMRGIKSE